MNSIFHRHSVRRFTDAPVTPEQEELLLRAAMAAPSACNQQPWEFFVLRDPEAIRRACTASPFARFARTAPLLIVPCIRRQCRLPDFALLDLAAATENLLLEADSLGLGATWIGVAPNELMTSRAEKALPELAELDLKPFCLVAVGVPAEEPQPADRFEESRIHRI